jgi:hypothetical protein
VRPRDWGNARFSSTFELLLVLLLAWFGFASVVLIFQEMAVSWDMLNHHLYLGWIAQSPRFDLDVLPASYQTYQFPYLYWPLYKMALAGWSGPQVGMALATLHLVTVPPVWMIARHCMPGATAFDVSMRVMGVLLGFLTPLAISLFDSTTNDLLSAAPFLWALALALSPFAPGRGSPRQVRRAIVLSGLFAGLSVACKLSNGPLVVLLPILWVAAQAGYGRKLQALLLGGGATMASFVISYGYWGWQLWTHFGNPFFPFFDGWFEMLRQAVGWHP